MRKTLDANTLQQVNIIAPDGFDWNIANDMLTDPELNKAVGAIGIHYIERSQEDPYSSTETAKQSGKSLWNSEGGSWSGDWEAFSYLAKMYNRDYLHGKMTKQITWSMVSAYYDNLSLPNSGLMKAATPWCGHFEIQPALWAVAHTTQFAVPGWKYLDSGCGYLDGGGSYVTLQSDDNSGDYTIIIETMDANHSQDISIEVNGNFSSKPLKVWRSIYQESTFEPIDTSKPLSGQFTLHLEPNAIYSLTTTTGQQKGDFESPPLQPFPFPYKTGFEKNKPGSPAQYFSDQGGVFEIQNRKDGQGQCLRQVVIKQGTEWEQGDTYVESIVGDTSWTDYRIATDINILENTGFATMMGRVVEVHRGHQPPEGYWFKIHASTSGSSLWQLFAGNQQLSSGYFPFKPLIYHRVVLSMKSNTIQVLIDGKPVTQVEDHHFSHGMAGLGSGFNLTEFDNFSIE